MEKATLNLFRFEKGTARKPNAFYELCEFAAEVWNNANEKKVTPARFFRDCKKFRKAYELAKIDFKEITDSHYRETNQTMPPPDRARLFFGKLKWRKEQYADR